MEKNQGTRKPVHIGRMRELPGVLRVRFKLITSYSNFSGLAIVRHERLFDAQSYSGLTSLCTDLHTLARAPPTGDAPYLQY
jgi:hypothetical protein